MRFPAFEAWIRRTLLPPVLPPGAMPFFSLCYLLMLLIPAMVPKMQRPDWLLTAVTVLLFLPLYFGFYWLRGWRRSAVLVAIGLIGVAALPANQMANTYVIYSMVLAAHLPMRSMLGVFVLVQLLMGLTVWALGGPWQLMATVNAVSGGSAMFGCRVWYANAAKNQALKLSQVEIQRVAALAERERIGRDLHDLLGHTLSVIALKSELAVKLMDRDIALAREEMREVERVTRKALIEVRRAVTGMRAHGLLAELATGRAALESAQVAFSYSVPTLELPQALENVLSMVLREAITNVIRHAGARSCRADLTVHDGRATLRIADDGCGGIKQHGNGLLGMQERIGAVGGDITLESPVGGGTRLTISLPVQEPDPGSMGTQAKHLRLVASA